MGVNSLAITETVPLVLAQRAELLIIDLIETAAGKLRYGEVLFWPVGNADNSLK